MTKNDFMVFAAALSTYYPRVKMFPNTQAVELWYSALADIEYSSLTAALKLWVETQTFPPTIADLRRMSATVQNGSLPDWGDAWEETRKMIRRYGWARPDEALEEMSPLTAETVRRIGWMELCSSENVDTVRAQFRQVFDSVARRAGEQRQVSDEVLQGIKNLRLDGDGLKKLGGGK